MSRAALRSAFRVEATVKAVYTGNGYAVPELLEGAAKKIVSASGDRVVVLEYDTGAVLCFASTADGETISNVCCSADGKWVFASSRSLQGFLWSLQTDAFHESSLKLHRTWLVSKHAVSSCAFSPCSTWLATATTDGALRLWDPSGNSANHSIQNDGGIVLQVRFATVSGKLFLFATCFSGMTAVFHIGRDSRERVCCLTDHTGAVEALDFFYDNAMLVTGGRDGKINVYRITARDASVSGGGDTAAVPAGRLGAKKRKKTGVLFEAAVSHSFTVLEEVSAVARVSRELLGEDYADVVDDASADKEVMAIGGETGKVRYFYLERTGRGRKCKKDLPPLTDPHWLDGAQGETGLPRIVSIVPVLGQRELVVATADHDLLFYSPTLEAKRLIVGSIDQVVDAKHVRADRVAAASNSAAVRVFHTDNPFCELLRGHSDVVLVLAVTACKRYLASGGKDRNVLVWDLQTSRCLAVLTGHTADVTGLAFGCPVEASSASVQLVSASADLSLKLWDMKNLFSEKKYAKLQQDQGVTRSTPVSIESSPNQTTPRAHEMDISAVSFNPTADTVASCGKDKTVKLWKKSGKSLQLLSTLSGHKRRVHCAVFSTHDRLLASGSGDTTVKLWSTNPGEGIVKSFQGHITPVLTLAFVNLGLQIISASTDGMLKVWGIKLHTCLATIQAHKDRIWSIDMFPGEQNFVTCSSDGSIHLWKDYTEADLTEKSVQASLQVQQRQLLSDKIREEKFADVVDLCLKLDRPRDLATALSQLKKTSPEQAEQCLREVLPTLDEDLIARLLKYIRKWMLSALTADVGALALKALLCSFHATVLAQSGPAREAVEALLAYGMRHHDRLRQQLQLLHLVPFFCEEPPAIPPVALIETES
ncbi:putative U3 small nucleolar RNA-associated protein 13 [Diplonema papillatum]|nr:putative U3 small nucleolar RNA-associated protein 13 [Diplonema papillatum]